MSTNSHIPIRKGDTVECIESSPPVEQPHLFTRAGDLYRVTSVRNTFIELAGKGTPGSTMYSASRFVRANGIERALRKVK